MHPRRVLSSVDDAFLTPLYDDILQHYIVCVFFNHEGIPASPGRKRMYERILTLLWEMYGKIDYAYYDSEFKTGIVKFESAIDASTAIELINTQSDLTTNLNNLVSSYSNMEDRSVARRIIDELFVRKRGEYISAVGCSTGDSSIIDSNTTSHL